MSKITTILHISDIHIDSGPDKQFDHSVVLDPLLKRVRVDYQIGLQPEMVVVTGDIAYKGIAEEYELATVFFKDLLAALKLDKDKLFIVPGNHDVNRKRYRPGDIPAYDSMKELNEELEHYREDLFKGMGDYFSFVKTSCPHLQSVASDLVPFVVPFGSACGKRLAIVGLNSAWMCRKSPDEREVAIGEFQVKNAQAALNSLGTTDLNLYLFLHPLDYLCPEDKNAFRSYIEGERSLLLTGHLHDAAGGVMDDLDGRLIQFQAGGAYLGSESDWPSRYHYISIDWEQNNIGLDFRAFDKNKRKWHVDSVTGDDGHKDFPLFKPSVEVTVGNAPVAARFPEPYRNWIIENYQHLDAEKLMGSNAIPLSLPEIFIPLFTDAPAEAKKKAGSEADLEKRDPVDLEELVATRQALLIEGHPGSGKTTLLKHVCYCLAREGRSCEALRPLAGYLPVLIFMKHLNAYLNDLSEAESAGLAPFAILNWYCRTKLADTIKGDMVKVFIEQGKAVLLLDGFDELQPQHRETVGTLFADLRLKHPGLRLVLTGRGHGLKESFFARFKENRVKINSLSMGQVEQFVKKWFNHFYLGTHGPGGRSAAALISELKVHPAIGALIDNPLMLTAICILYHDQRELPGQRAELYKRFVNNMLFRRFGNDFEQVMNFLKNLARKMHTAKAKSVDEKEAILVLKALFPAGEQEPPTEYEARMKQEFTRIESESGLLKFEAGQFEFQHLTFQEFLCADCIYDNSTNCIDAIEPYWDDDWYKEMIELYIGNASIANKAMANAIVGQALEHNHRQRWLKAAAGLYDIQENRRDRDVLARAKERLQQVFTSEDEHDRLVLAGAGELLGWLRDPRDLKAFVPIEGGDYDLEDIGQVTVAPYEIGKYPVVNQWFEEFVTDGGYREERFWSKQGAEWLRKEGVECPGFWHDRRWRCPNAPVVGISWYEAEAFCRWLTLTTQDGLVYRLLTEAEWQIAAAGKKKRAYPWGNDEDMTRFNCGEGEKRIGRTSSVGIFQRGKTPDGVHDLAGNVWEWCADQRGPSRVLRGGRWFSLARNCRSVYRDVHLPDGRSDNFGFRLARSQKG